MNNMRITRPSQQRANFNQSNNNIAQSEVKSNDDTLSNLDMLSTYVKVIVYFVPTFFSISASEFLKFSKFKYAENGIH